MHYLVISGQSYADAPSARQGAWIGWWFYARRSFSLDTSKLHILRALTAHSPRTYGALKKWCKAAKGPMELHFIHAALGTSGSYILCFVLHALTRCQATKCIDWECQYSMFLLCSTRFERVSGNKIDSLEVPTPSFALCFTCFERMLGDTIESLRVPPFKVSTVFVLWEDTR